MGCFYGECWNYRPLAPRIVENYRCLAHFLPFLSPSEIVGFIKGRKYVDDMPKRRKLGQKHTALVRASIIRFLNKMEFATQKEIGLHLWEDDTLPLSRGERRRVGYTTLRSPVFICFHTANVVGEKGYKRQETLWKNNPDYVDWRTAYGERKKD